MGYLRPQRAKPRRPKESEACLRAFDEELDYLFEALRRLGARTDEIEDLAQEVFVVLFKRWEELDLSRPLRPYLFAIAFRIVRAQRRKTARETSHEELEIEDTAAGPEKRLQARETTRMLTAALARVPLPRRAVVVMHDLDEVPVADIAEQLSISRFGTYARLRKGRRELAAAVRHLLKPDQAG